jgi:hypothetical protein
MSALSPSATPPSPDPVPDALVLRPSVQLGSTPLAGPRTATVLVQPPADPADGFAAHFQRALDDSPAWVLIALAALATAGWLFGRRRRRELETDKDSVLWAGVQAPGSSIITELNEMPEDAPAASGPPTAVGSDPPPVTTLMSRREATLIDLQQLEGKLRRRRARGDLLAATSLLQQHVAEFRYTSPWVFLELREIAHLLGRGQDWELAREAFRARFGQRAPMWQAPSTADAELVQDALIAHDIAAQWPFREARMVIRRWLLGEAAAPAEEYHAPILALGVYRDLLFLDRLLDRVMASRPQPVDSLL